MYDFSNLSDYEFEVLAKDILQRKTSQRFNVYKQGKDGGIDASNGIKDNLLIAQAKRYTTNYSLLKRTLDGYVERVNNIKPKELFIFTSLQLTPQNINEIYSLFVDYMPNENNIFDGNAISQFLEEKNNRDIVYKNFKLWLCATNILSLFREKHTSIDSQIYVNNILSQKTIYVETDAYKEAQKRLKNSNIILITGEPGIGKSTLTNMLVLYYFSQNYSIYFSSSRDIGSLKRILSEDDNFKQLFVVDDFLGQICVDINSDSINELKTFVSAIKNRPNKLLLLNSRVTIFNKANQSYNNSFDSILKQLEHYVIDINNISKFQKAKMLYNHLYFKDISNDYFDEIKKDKNYYKIIEHKKYNPRIIEFITDSNRLKKNTIKPTNYISYILNVLNHPNDVWKNEIESNTSKEDRILLQTLYSITDQAVSYDELKNAVNARLLVENVDHTLPNFENSIEILTDSCIKTTWIDNKRLISVLNPSVNDYLKELIDNNTNIKQKILETATLIQQFEKFDKSFLTSERVKAMVADKSFFKLGSVNEPISYYFLRYLYENKISNIQFKNVVHDALLDINKYSNTYRIENEYFEILCFLLQEDNFKIYDLGEFIKTKGLFSLLSILSLENISKLLKLYNEHLMHFITNINFTKNLKDIIAEKIELETMSRVEEMLTDILSSIDDNDIDEYNCVDLLEEYANAEIRKVVDEILSTFDDIIEINIKVDDIDYYNISSNIDYNSCIKEYFKDKENYYSDYHEYQEEIEDANYEIDEMFST